MTYQESFVFSMTFVKHSAALAVLIAAVGASPAAQNLDFAALDAAPTVPSGPSIIPHVDGVETASILSSVAITGVATAATTGVAKRDDAYTPYYPALATGYTTDPALTKTATAPGACATQPEAGTYCGFINPLDPCAPQPDGYGPVPTPDTASAFLAHPPFHSSAKAAPTKVPSTNNTQYTQAVAGQSYLALFTLKTYDVSTCAAKCDSWNLCTAFNIFFERDPSLNPTNNDSTYDPGYPTVWGQNCPNPPSMTSIKCTLWGSNIDASMATNNGQKREDFEIVITGSDGYDKTNVVTPPDCSAPSGPTPTSTRTTTTPKSTTPAKPPTWPWGKPKNCGGRAINAPRQHMGSRFIPGPFNPQVCSDYAILQNQANQRAGKPQCKMFNAYYLHKNGVPYGTYCSIYSHSLESAWATANKVQWERGDRSAWWLKM
ncbi:uncharacterized protein MYCFIDRAFT_79360 [Pseudocercospora fijiensis CIRAD86]|uniref:Apple domain-containing protein n=1 Tax=Pseudocercospora fijiensis (strain CIRAD86) TaxID=383855 RepID=M3ALX0_PSEFD|nr:uncharacterized protein MYCFIDRAFT_79360 [Pseudocercospora fijiensis CIRAD86]EME78143.1 hypothetical protein MYCFIDRAFT_79360 [Pseudocercospora fijiensis CIRAD86]